MSDLISIQKAIEKINERARKTFALDLAYAVYLGALQDVENDLRQMPTIDAVPVVRCQYCMHFEYMSTCTRNGIRISRVPNDFCSRGEKRDRESKSKDIN